MSGEPTKVSQTADAPAPMVIKLDTGLAMAQGSSIASQDSLSTSPAAVDGPVPLPKIRATSPDSPAGQDQLRRASGKIANLRAAFEQKSLNDSSPPRPPVNIVGVKRFEKSPVQTTEWETELAKLKDDLEKETEMRKIYEEKCTEMQVQLDGLQSQPSQPNGDHGGWERQCVELEQEKARVVMDSNTVRRQLEDIQQENTRLIKEAKNAQRQFSEVEFEKVQALEQLGDMRRQIFELKRTISAATQIESQVTDATFAQEMGTLYHETQNWVVNHFRRAKVEKSTAEMCECLERIAEPKQLERLRPIYENFDSLDKLAILQTTAVSYMMEIFEEPLLFGMPAQQEWKKGIRRTAEGLPSILAPVTYNKWRSSTLNTIRNTDTIRDAVVSAAASMAEMICITLTTLTESEESENRIPSLKTIVHRAIQLAHLFRVQRAQFDFQLPPPETVFDPDIMEEITVDGEPQPGRAIKCATFPSVTKLGDENGDNVHLSNIISKARVLCHANR